MMKSCSFRALSGIAFTLVFLGLSSCIDKSPSFIDKSPYGWHKAGSNPNSYAMGVDNSIGFKRNSGAITLQSIQESINGFGTLMQSIRADKYWGKKIRLSGWIKAKEVTGWAGLWLRVDDAKTSIAFDNMEDRAIKGTVEWRYCEIILPVEATAMNISFGILLDGNGQIWADGLHLDVVSSITPATGENITREEPANLDFSK